MQAYRPLTGVRFGFARATCFHRFAQTKKLKDDKLVEIAKKYGKTTAQVRDSRALLLNVDSPRLAQLLIRWSLQSGYCALPKSSKPERIQENANVFDFAISTDDMKVCSLRAVCGSLMQVLLLAIAQTLSSFDVDLHTAWDSKNVK